VESAGGFGKYSSGLFKRAEQVLANLLQQKGQRSSEWSERAENKVWVWGTGT
jgi:hypothetical protein